MKTKTLLIVSLLFLSAYSAVSQTYLILARPAGVKEWGYANLKGEFVIPAQYKNCIGFSEEGLAAVYDAKSKQFYFIRPDGQKLETEVTGFKLIEVFGFGMKGFRDGMAPVKIGEKWGYLNTEGKLAVPANYDKVTQFAGGYASAKKGEKFYVLDKGGKEIPVDIPGIADLNDFSEQLASFKTSGDLVGFIDGSGKPVIQAKFKAAGDFSGGLAWAKDDSGLLGYIDMKGEWVIPPKFDAGKNFDPETGLARIKKGDTWAYTDKNGELTFMKDTDIWEDFFSGLARGKKGGLFGFYNAKGEWAIQPQFDGARDFKNGYAAVKKGETWGIIDKSGNWAVEPMFDEVKDVEIVK